MDLMKLFSFFKNIKTQKEVSAREIELKKAYRITLAVGAFTMVSFFLLANIVHFFNNWNSPFNGLFPLVNGDTLKYVLLGASVAVSLLIRLLRYLLPSGRVSIHFPTRMNIFSDVVQRLFFTSDITFTLCILVAFFGLAVFLVSGNPLDFYIFLVLSLVLFATNFPGYQDWKEKLKKLDTAGEDSDKKRSQISS